MSYGVKWGVRWCQMECEDPGQAGVVLTHIFDCNLFRFITPEKFVKKLFQTSNSFYFISGANPGGSASFINKSLR